MGLTGKLLLAWLEEDNEQRALFRVRPLMSAQGALSQEDLDALADEGFLRVVPDRKEQATFKSRMRELGHLCVIDLRGSMEKTRANKNYAPARGENNRTVIYSDVILAVPEALVFEVMPEGRDAQPLTPRFCLRNGCHIQGPLSAATRGQEGEAITVAPDSDRLFAVQLPDGRETLFYWPEAAENSVPLPETPRMERPAARHEERPAPIVQMPAPEPAAPEAPAPSQPCPLRAYIPFHEVVERKRSQRGECIDAGPAPAEVFRCALDTMWRAEDTRTQAVRMLSEMPDADALMGRQFSPEMKSAAAAALRQELQRMEAERLELLMQTDRARRDEQAVMDEAVSRADARARAQLERLSAEEAEVRARVEAIRQEEAGLVQARAQLLDSLRDAGGRVLERPMGEALPFADAAARVAAALTEDGFQVDEAQAACLLLLLLMCEQVQLDAPTAADSVTAAQAVARALGAGVLLLPEEDAQVRMPAGGDGWRVVIARSGVSAPDGGTRLIAGCGAPEDVWNEYALTPWPCVPIAVRPGFPAGARTQFPPASREALLAALPSDPAALPEAAQSLLTSLEAGLALAGSPLPVALRAAIARFAPLALSLSGSVTAALDTAIAAYALPWPAYRSENVSAVAPLLAGLPMSESRLP